MRESFFVVQAQRYLRYFNSFSLFYFFQTFRTLLVDDSKTNLFVLREALKSWGIKSDELIDGTKALAKIKEAKKNGKPYDLMLLDYNMPKMDGLEVMQQLNDNGVSDDLKVIMLSSDSINVYQKKCESYGISGCIYKPIKQSVLYEAIIKQFVPEDFNNGKQKIIEKKVVEQKNTRVLLVEDNEINQKVSIAIFKTLGYKLEIAINGKEAIDILENKEYDIIFMDIHMPLINGLDATKILRGKGLKTIIVAMTANAMKGDKEACLAAGMNDYIGKPVRIFDIKTMLEKWT